MAGASHDIPGNADTPVTATDFAAAMAALGPFEPNAHVAVAVSGGADSMALLHLARRWVQDTGSRLVALTVDHGLRAEAAAEARQVGAWARSLGVDHHGLAWAGPHPSAGLQEAARQARYDLLTHWCRSHGVLHLLVAHQRDDQAETVMIRLGSGSGVDGLAGMAAVSVRQGVRILRPLLALSRRRLRATLKQAGAVWLEDPSNDDPAFERVRVRRFLHAGAAIETAEDWTGLLVRMAGVMGRLRTLRARAVDRWLAKSVAVYDAGYASIRRDDWAALPVAAAALVLARVLVCVSGRPYPPGQDSVDRLARSLHADPRGGGTLSGCRVSSRRGRLLVSREAPRGGTAPVELHLDPGASLTWDRRFTVHRLPDGGDGAPDLIVRRLGRDGWAALGRAGSTTVVPPVVRPALPSIWSRGRPVHVPHLGFTAPEMSYLAEKIRIRFAPARPLTPNPFDLSQIRAYLPQ